MKNDKHVIRFIFLVLICLISLCLGCSSTDSTDSDEIPAGWVGLASVKDNQTGGSVILEFGSASDASSNSNIKYNIYYEKTSEWDNSTWRNNSTLLNVAPETGSEYANAYTVTGLTNGLLYKFGVRVENGDGNEDANTNTMEAVPTDTTPPSWGDIVGIAQASDSETDGSVMVEFDTANDASGNSNIKYNIYYAQTSAWDDETWENNSTLLNVDPVAGSTYDNAFTVTGLLNGISYTFGVKTEDEEGNKETNTSTALAIPTELILFSDDFSSDTTLDNYTVSGSGSILHHETSGRLQILTGVGTEAGFSHTLPVLSEGAFTIDFFPMEKYLDDGSVTITLLQDQNNYYQLFQSDGGGAGFIKKVVNGTEVENVPFQNEYSQSAEYQINIFFSPEKVAVGAFNEELVMDSNTAAISVNSFEINLSQQDAYFDNVYFSNNKSYVNITSPIDLYLQPSQDLDITAAAIGLKIGWGIKFVLDSGTSAEKVLIDKEYPYLGTFTDVIKAEHTLEAFVVNQNNYDVDGLFTVDMKDPVGIGDYYVAIGDSITRGVGDDNSADNVSNDGRNSGGGYEPILNDLLTSTLNYPHTIVDEGEQGETSEGGRDRIAEVIASHPKATRILILYGTNDSSIFHPILSGQGLNPGDFGYDNTYKDYMQQIIDAINAAGREPCVAKVPIALADCSYCDPYPNPSLGEKNVLIREYNDVIDELVGDPSNNISVIPPDFYSYFENHEEEYIDWVHPNGLGYISMAVLWHDALTN